MFFCFLKISWVISFTNTLTGETCRWHEQPSWHLPPCGIARHVQTLFPVPGAGGRELWGSGTAALVTSIPRPLELFAVCEMLP